MRLLKNDSIRESFKHKRIKSPKNITYFDSILAPEEPKVNSKNQKWLNECQRSDT